jgi:hypothetical protein
VQPPPGIERLFTPGQRRDQRVENFSRIVEALREGFFDLH